MWNYSGVDINRNVPWPNLWTLLKNPGAAWDRPAISQVHYDSKNQGYSIRTQKWRYTEWNEGRHGRELYDHHNDPHERVNLAASPLYKQLISSLSQKLQLYSKTYKAHPAPRVGEMELEIFKK